MFRLWCIVLAVSALNVHAQQRPALSQYMLNNYYFNPAYSGEGELYSFSFLHRTQWTGYEDYTGSKGAPATQLFTATANLDSTGHTVGFMFSRDRVGYFNAFQGELSYAYKILITKESTLSVGARGGIATQSVDQARYVIKHPNDPYLEGGTQRESKPDVTLGIWYNHRKYYAGISARGFITNANYQTLGIESGKTIFITGGYHFKTSGRLTITPSAQLVTSRVKTLVQGGVMLLYNDAVWGGVTYRPEESVSVLLGFSFLERKLRLGYGFDITAGNKELKTGTSHEIMLNYRLGKLHVKKPVKKIVE